MRRRIPPGVITRVRQSRTDCSLDSANSGTCSRLIVSSVLNARIRAAHRVGICPRSGLHRLALSCSCEVQRPSRLSPTLPEFVGMRRLSVLPAACITLRRLVVIELQVQLFRDACCSFGRFIPHHRGTLISSRLSTSDCSCPMIRSSKPSCRSTPSPPD